MASTATIENADLRRLDRAVDALVEISSKSLNTVMKGLVPRVARSAAKATKPGAKFPPNPKNRPKRDIRGRLVAKRKRGEVPWWADYQLTVYKQGRGGAGIKKTLYVTEEKLSKFIRIPNRGVAKAAWFGAIPRELSGRTSGLMGGIKGSRRYSSGRLERKFGQVVGAKLENRVRYNAKAGPNAHNVAIQKQANWLEKALEREKAKIQRAFERKAARG